MKLCLNYEYKMLLLLKKTVFTSEKAYSLYKLGIKYLIIMFYMSDFYLLLVWIGCFCFYFVHYLTGGDYEGVCPHISSEPSDSI